MSHPENGGTKFSRKGSSIYEALCATDRHPSAETLYRQLRETFPNLSRTTVYTNLNRLREQGSVICVGVVDGCERYDANTTPHPHFFCDRCGAVLDFHGLEGLQELIRGAERDSACRIQGYDLRFHGLCAACAAEQDSLKLTEPYPSK